MNGHQMNDSIFGSGDANFGMTINTREIQRLLNYESASDNSQRRLSYLPHERGQQILNHGGGDSLIKDKTDLLYTQFLDILQCRASDTEVFDTIQDLIQICNDVINEVVRTKHLTSKSQLGELEWLEHEQNTWKLIYALYKDRLLVQNDQYENEMPLLGASEKEVIQHLYASNNNVREYQLIIDWLEACFIKQNAMEIGHSTDSTVGWENTLFQLQNNPTNIAFRSHHEIVKSLDPDAPIREKKPLHPLDEEDNLRLSKCIFYEIRQGRIDEAMSLCKYCGQTWRAAILEGWRLHEDPNYESGNVREKTAIEGNPRRDLWKKCAWMMADSTKYDEYTRAIAGVFCGHLESLLSLLKDSWSDLLWAYLKVQIDIRVETEIRSCCLKSYLDMPNVYWNSKMSLDQIFDELAVHKNDKIRDSATSKMHIIQKYIILDNIHELLKTMHLWITQEKLSPHTLRFLSHVVLFMRQIGKVDKEEIADQIIKAYVECLIEFNDSHLVAFYTAALPGKMQIILYSELLKRIKNTAERTTALKEAIAAGLDVEGITKYTVQCIRNCQDNIGENGQLLQTEISNLDLEKISALEWLTFYPEHKGELLWQTNAMIRTFLAESKIECVKKAFEMVPNNSITQILTIYGSKDNFPCREECSIKEYLCYKIYLVAIQAFNDWMRLYHNKPKEPQTLKSNANFTERVLSQHKEDTFHLEMNRWNMNLNEQFKVTRDALFNVLLFPDKGWLIDPDTSKDIANIDLNSWSHRLIQLEKLRTLCIPEIVLLLQKVLHLSKDYKSCIKLADEISNEDRKLYQVYSKHKLAEMLSKIAESSLALMNEKLDPWGYPVTN